MNDYRYQSRYIKQNKKHELAKISVYMFCAKRDLEQVHEKRSGFIITLTRLNGFARRDGNRTSVYIRRDITLTKKKLFLLDCEQKYIEDDLKTHEHNQTELRNIHSVKNASLFNLSCKMDKIATEICDIEREIKYLRKTFCL